MISRCIMPYASRPRKTIAYPSDHIKDDHSEQLSFLEHDLACIATLKGEYKLTPEAKALGRLWHDTTNTANYDKATSDGSDNWANRRYSHVHKLAMILAASQRDELIITDKDLEEAIRKIEEVHVDFNKVFALSDERRETKGAREIEAFLQAKESITLTDLMVAMRQKFTKREIADALDVLVAGGIVIKENLPIMLGGSLIAAIVLTYRGERP